jgi:FkbM family methyltransferase
MDLSNFNWGPSNQWYIDTITNEIFNNNCYEKFLNVEKGDVVLDVGASIGPFSFSIIDRDPKHVICIEPSLELFPTLVGNTNHGPVTCLNKAIYSDDLTSVKIGEVYGSTIDYRIVPSIKFSSIVSLYNLEKIDFLKTDCEGGEYDIFNIDNLIWIKSNVKKIVGEWHLGSQEHKNKFREFRDVYLRVFNNYQVYSVDNIDIKWDLWNDQFIEYYSTIIIHIDNR